MLCKIVNAVMSARVRINTLKTMMDTDFHSIAHRKTPGPLPRSSMIHHMTSINEFAMRNIRGFPFASWVIGAHAVLARQRGLSPQRRAGPALISPSPRLVINIIFLKTMARTTISHGMVVLHGASHRGQWQALRLSAHILSPRHRSAFDSHVPFTVDHPSSLPRAPSASRSRRWGDSTLAKKISRGRIGQAGSEAEHLHAPGGLISGA